MRTDLICWPYLATSSLQKCILKPGGLQSCASDWVQEFAKEVILQSEKHFAVTLQLWRKAGRIGWRRHTVMWLHSCPLTVLSRTLSLLGENADDAALTKSSKRISYCCWLYYLNTKLEGAELKLLMPFCAKKITMGRLWRSSQSKQWQRAQAGKKMERTLCNEGQEVMYQVMMEPFHLFFINACRPNCCDQNVRFGRRASFGPNGADVTHGISAANPVLLVTA